MECEECKCKNFETRYDLSGWYALCLKCEHNLAITEEEALEIIHNNKEKNKKVFDMIDKITTSLTTQEISKLVLLLDVEQFDTFKKEHKPTEEKMFG